MYLQVVRGVFTDKSTISKLFVNGTFECSVLEDKDRYLEEGDNNKVYGETAIPRGIYTVELSVSTRFGVLLPHIKNVKGFTGIRIHSGNSDKDSYGCLLVGTYNEKNPDWVSGSKKALKALMLKLEQEDDIITLEIV